MEGKQKSVKLYICSLFMPVYDCVLFPLLSPGLMVYIYQQMDCISSANSIISGRVKLVICWALKPDERNSEVFIILNSQ